MMLKFAILMCDHHKKYKSLTGKRSVEAAAVVSFFVFRGLQAAFAKPRRPLERKQFSSSDA
jgi:hypothetical protein